MSGAQETSQADSQATMTCCNRKPGERCALMGCNCFDILHDVKLFYVSDEVKKRRLNILHVLSACAGAFRQRCWYFIPRRVGGRALGQVSTKAALKRGPLWSC